MRKINTEVVLHPDTFNPVFRVFVVNEDGSKEKFAHELVEKYTPEQSVMIGRVNATFIKNGQDMLTEDEINYLIRKPEVDEPTEQDLQKLAGFTVEKKIIYDNK